MAKSKNNVVTHGLSGKIGNTNNRPNRFLKPVRSKKIKSKGWN
jgi:hypothetical protein